MKNHLGLLIVILSIVLLIGCVPSEYKEYIEAGNEAIHANDYDTAIMNYSKAIAIKDTEEANTVYKILLDVQKGIATARLGNYKVSGWIFNQVQEIESNIEIVDVIHKKVELLLDESDENLSIFESIRAQIDEAKILLEDNKFDEAIEIYNRVLSSPYTTNESPILDLIIEAELLSNEASKEKKRYEDDKKAETFYLTPEQGEEYLRKFLLDWGIMTEGFLNRPDVYVELYDIENDENYKFQIYQLVIIDAENAHTATAGWYSVNQNSGIITDTMSGVSYKP